MRPGEVLDRHGELLMRLESDHRFGQGMGLIVAGEARRMVQDSFPHWTDEQKDRIIDHQVDAFLAPLKTSVRIAEAYRVTEDMVDLLVFAAAGLEEDDEFDRDLAPTPAGFVRFDKPLPMGDFSDGKVEAHWLVWGPIATQPDGKIRTGAFWLTDGGDPWSQWIDSRNKVKVADIMGHWNMVGWDSLVNGSSMGPKTYRAEELLVREEHERMGANLVLSVLNKHPIEKKDEELAERIGGVMDEAAAALAEQANDARYVHALWLLLGQTITQVTQEKPERAAGRRAVRRGLPPRVTTIALRRVDHRPGEGESIVEWQHRWIVRGHWRWQACGVGRKERRRIWISPFVKGPEGAPLKQSEKVYDLRR